MNNDPTAHEAPPSFWSARYAVGSLVMGGMATYFLLTERLAHVVGAVPFLLLLACPLMHVFVQRLDALAPVQKDKPPGTRSLLAAESMQVANA